MNNNFLFCIIFVVMFTVLYIFLYNNSANHITLSIQKVLEHAYFEGQKDAINGNVRIQYNESTNTWKWIKSPWDDGIKPIFDPGEKIVKENKSE